jgi:hypothetical protein
MTAPRRGAGERSAARVVRLRPLVLRSEPGAGRAPAGSGEALDKWIGPCYRVDAWRPAAPGRWWWAGWIRLWARVSEWLEIKLYPAAVTRSAAPEPAGPTAP